MQTVNVMSHIMLSSREPTPEIGMGATVCLWTDRHAATVVEVKRFRRGARAGQVREVTVQRDIATPTHAGMTDAQGYTYERDPEGKLSVFRADRHGRFRGAGSSLAVGHRSEYYDFSF